MKGDQVDDSASGIRAFAILLSLAVILAGYLLKDQISSRVVASAAAIQMIKAPKITLIDFCKYPTCEKPEQYAGIDRLLSRALELDPNNQAAWQNLVKVRWATGDCAGVEQLLASRLLREAPGGQFIDLISALLDIQADQFRGRANYPHAAEIGTLLAQAGKDASDQGLVAEALQWYKSAFLFEPTLKTAEWLASYYTAQADNLQVNWVWDYMAHEKAGTEDGWWAKFHQAKLVGNIDVEIDTLKRGAESSLDPFQFWVELGDVFKRTQAYEDAITAYEEAHSIQPVQIGPVINIGDAYRLMNDFRTAERYFTLAHSMDINNYYVYYYMSVTYRSMGRLDDAINELQKGIDIQEQQGLNPWEWYQHLGNWYMEADRCRDAKEAFGQALNWQPGEASLQEGILRAEACIQD